MAVTPASLSAGWRAHCVASAADDAQFTPREDALVLCTPTNPGYYWGNCLLLPHAPRDQDLAHWCARFKAELPEAQHVAIGFDVPTLAEPLPTWQAAGFEIEDCTVLELAPADLAAPTDTRSAGRVTMRSLRLPDEAEAVVDLQVTCDERDHDSSGYRRYRSRAMAAVAGWQARGVGDWFAAWVDGTMVANCGLVHDGQIGSVQHVETHPHWRRQGLCRALVQSACRHGFERWGLQRIVVSADPGDVAIRIYRAMGFRDIGATWQAQRRHPDDRR
jgi:ribosomal protein S18 acetylase RimI-like enzyme